MQEQSVLVVDDDRDSAFVTAAMISELGFKTAIAESGTEAINRIVENHDRWNSVLMDVLMPEINGLNATRMIRKFENANGLRKLPIIALTGGLLIEGKDICTVAGMDDIIIKPATFDKLEHILAQYLKIPVKSKKAERAKARSG